MIQASFEKTGAGKLPVYVIGHKNPDTDAICSALGCAELLRLTRYPDAVAACCGGLNPRTRWVLERAGLEAPHLIMDLRPTAETICRADVIKAHEHETFLDVYQRMERAEVRTIPIVDAEGHVTGIASIQDLLKLLLHNIEDKAEARRVRTTIANMARTLEGHIACGKDLDTELDFILTVSASSEETVEDRLHEYPREQLVVVVGDRPEVHRMALEVKVRAIVLTGGAQMAPDLLERARKEGCAVLSCHHDTASTTQLIRCSRRIADAVDRNFKSFGAKTHIANLRTEIQHVPQALFPVVREDTGELVGVFSKSDLLEPPRQRLVLVDHNELSQAVPGAADANILEVLDHHRLSGNLVSREPIRFINEPVGSTCTIVARLYQLSNLRPSPAIAICLCAGLISDTLNLTSPTTTATDREVLSWLAGQAGIVVEDFSRSFFAAGSLLRSSPAETILNTDRKEFVENGWSISISQIEELSLEHFPSRADDLRAALVALAHDRKQDFACLIVTDIRSHNSLLLVTGSQSVIDEIDFPHMAPDLFEMDGVVSRKKQFFPFISRVLARAKPRPEAAI
ncbi:MAG: Inorganic diphosphatase [Verrucomicrobiales bacterium]|nr:Inorganic diphosphatase [Verrucomicrobiales bacterium]